MVIIREKGGGEVEEGKGGIKVTEEDLTLGDEHTKPYTDDTYIAFCIITNLRCTYIV